MKQLLKSGPEVVGAYFRLFVNRRAFTIQSKKPHAESGRHYYFRPKEKGTEQPVSLTEDVLRQHLEGTITIGLYALNPSTQQCKWVAIDADYKDSMEDLLKLQYHPSADKVQAALEMSKRGGHLWIFFQKPLLANVLKRHHKLHEKDKEQVARELSERLGRPVKTLHGETIKRAVTESMLNEYTRSVQQGHDSHLSAAWLPALCEVLGDDTLLRHLLPERLRAALELGEAMGRFRKCKK